MKKRILCLLLSFILLLSMVFSSFSVYADFDINDYIEVHEPEIPEVDTNGDLLEDDVDNSFDDDFYNSSDEIDEDDEDNVTFDEKQSYSADSNYVSDSNNNSNSSTVKRKSIARNSTASINDDSESGISAQSDDAEDDTLNIGLLENWLDSAGFYPFVITKDNVLQCFQLGFYKYWSSFIKDNSNYNDNNYHSYYLLENYPDLFTNENLIILKYDSYYLKANGYSDCYVYEFIFCEDDYYLENSSTVDTDSTKGNFFEARVGVNSKNTQVGLSAVHFNFSDIDYYSFGSVGGSTTLGMATDISVVYTGGHKLFIGGEEVPIVDPDNPYSNLDVTGMIFIDDNAVDLTWVAGASDEITDEMEYDVRLFALDMQTAPGKLTSDLRYVDLSSAGYTSVGTINIDNQSISDTADLESIYYYIHQMKAYDDSEESVTGYKFECFEIRNTCTFVLAFKIKGSADDYVVCADFVYDYEKTIDEAMSDYTVKKDYKDFPDIMDYIEDFPDVEDFLPDGENPGVIDWILAYIKWIGACVKVLGKNFIGFFKWLKDCVPIVWDNLGIALYNMVCDLKSLALYLFKPKTKSINTLVDSKIPGFTLIRNSFKSTSKADLPYIKLFGTKFGFDFSVIPSKAKTFLYNLSTIIIYIVFAIGIIKLIGKVFGFNIHGGSDDSSDDS